MSQVRTVPERPAVSRQNWRQDPEGVRSDILAAARAEFAANGLSGARIQEIAERTRTSKRMIYYYFEDKESLYRKVLEQAYNEVREGERQLQLDGLPPIEALRRLIEFTFDHHQSHPDFIRLVMIENIHGASYLSQSASIRDLNETAIDKVTSIYNQGVGEGVFRPGFDPLEIHWHISAAAFFNVSNRPTFSQVFGHSLWAAQGQKDLRKHTVEMVLRLVLKDELIAEHANSIHAPTETRR